MRIAKVIGTVTLNRALASYEHTRLKLAVPLTLHELNGPDDPQAEPLVVWDDLGAAIGSQIALSEGREAAQPFHPERKPVDAYNAALLDEVNLDKSALRVLKQKSQLDNASEQ